MHQKLILQQLETKEELEKKLESREKEIVLLNKKMKEDLNSTLRIEVCPLSDGGVYCGGSYQFYAQRLSF